MSVKPARVSAFGVILRMEGAPKIGRPLCEQKISFSVSGTDIPGIPLLSLWRGCGCCFPGAVFLGVVFLSRSGGGGGGGACVA